MRAEFARAARRGSFASNAAQRGLSLVELLISIVISLLVGLAAAGSAMMFTASQRQGVGAGGASINSITVMNGIKADASLVGLGFFDNSTVLCSTLNLSVGTTKVTDGTAFTPLQVASVGNSDQLDLVYATQVEAGSAVLLDASSDGASADLRSLLPVSVGQAVLLSPENTGACTVRTVTANTASTVTDPQRLTFAAGGRHNDGAFTAPQTYPTRAKVSMLGGVRWNRYRVDGSEQLVLDRPIDGGGSVVLLRNVVAFRVQYGVAATATATTLDSWVDASGTFASVTAANIDRIRALRIGVLVRSPQREKAETDGVCRATTAAPALFGTVPSSFTGSDWQCYRYRTSTVVIPLRNYVI